MKEDAASNILTLFIKSHLSQSRHLLLPRSACISTRSSPSLTAELLAQLPRSWREWQRRLYP